MPKRRRATRRSGRNVKRRLFKRRRVARVPRNRRMRGAFQGQPRTKMVTLRYADQRVITPATFDIPKLHSYSCNNIFDPDVTGAGHQPMGYDQWASLYSRARVIGSRIKVTFYGETPGTGAAKRWRVGIQRATDNSSANENNVERMLETGMPFKYLGGDTDDKAMVMTTFTPQRLFSIKDVKDDEEEVQTMDISGPSRLGFYHVFVVGADRNVLGDPVIINVVIDYQVQLFDPHPLPQST